MFLYAMLLVAYRRTPSNMHCMIASELLIAGGLIFAQDRMTVSVQPLALSVITDAPDVSASR